MISCTIVRKYSPVSYSDGAPLNLTLSRKSYNNHSVYYNLKFVIIFVQNL